MNQSHVNPLFIFPYENPIKEDVRQEILHQMNHFIHQWNTHGTMLKASVWFEECQFLLVEVDANLVSPSGCSKDKLYHFIENLNKKTGLNLGDVSYFYLKREGKIIQTDKKGLREIWEKEPQSIDYKLFPTWLSTREGFQQSWGKPLGAWAAQLRLENKSEIFQA